MSDVLPEYNHFDPDEGMLQLFVKNAAQLWIYKKTTNKWIFKIPKNWLKTTKKHPLLNANKNDAVSVVFLHAFSSNLWLAFLDMDQKTRLNYFM